MGFLWRCYPWPNVGGAASEVRAKIAGRWLPLLFVLTLAACGTPRDNGGAVGEQAGSPALCRMAQAQSFSAFADLPPQIATDLLSRFADVPTADSAANSALALARRDGFFNGSDMRSGLLPNRRFVQALRRGDEVVVIYEHGRGPHIHVVLYRLSAPENGGVYHAFVNAISSDRVHCETAARLFADPRDPALWSSRIDW